MIHHARMFEVNLNTVGDNPPPLPPSDYRMNGPSPVGGMSRQAPPPPGGGPRPAAPIPARPGGLPTAPPPGMRPAPGQFPAGGPPLLPTSVDVL